MLHLRFIARELATHRHMLAIFLVCVVLALVALVALGGYQDAVDRAMQRDARQLHAADIIARSSFPFTPSLEAALGELAAEEGVRVARTWEFYSVARTPRENTSLLAAVKIVEPAYPHYGQVLLASGAPFHEALAPGGVVVERNLLDRLGLAPGDDLRLGRALLTIKDVVVSEPDRPVSVLALGPRIFVHAADLQQLDLVTQGSRVRYLALIKVAAPDGMAALVERLAQAADPVQERVETFRSADSRLKRFFDNLMFFLNLIGIFTLSLAGIGIHSTLTAVMQSRAATVAVIKAMGGTNAYIRNQYLVLVLAIGALGTTLGIGLGLLLQQALPGMFAGLAPVDLVPAVSPRAIGEGALLGTVVVLLFALIPLQRLKHLKPAAILRHETAARSRDPALWASFAAVGLTLAGVILLRLEDLRTGLLFIGGTLAALAALTGMTVLVLAGLRRLPVSALVPRQALKGLFRPRNATRPILITLTASLGLLMAIFLIEHNLDATYVQAYPADTPNVFLIDIQPHQTAALAAQIGAPPLFFPIVRARLQAINGTPVDPRRERRRKTDNLARPFNLTYREHLLEDEKLIQGPALFDPRLGVAQVSVLDTIARIGGIVPGDRLDFNIQGVPLGATVTSVRTRTRESLQPYFYFVFPEAALKAAPQTLFTALHLPPGEVAALQNRIVARFPNISVIDASQTLAAIGTALGRFSWVVRFLAAFSLTAGFLLIVSSILATRAARIREAVYYKVLGARNRFVLAVFAVEHLWLGAISALQAMAAAQAIAWTVCTRYLQIPYDPQVRATLLAGTAAVLTVMGVGLAASRSILRQKPVNFLRDQLQE